MPSYFRIEEKPILAAFWEELVFAAGVRGERGGGDVVGGSG